MRSAPEYPPKDGKSPRWRRSNASLVRPEAGHRHDDRFQGHGYGRAALDAIVALVRDRGLPTIRLSVVPENKQALEVYRRNGFAETGEIHGGEIVMERQI